MSVTEGVGWGDFLGPGREASRRRTAASRESSSKGLRLCFTLAVSMAVWVALTRGLIYRGDCQSGAGRFLRFEIGWERGGGFGR